MSNSLFAALSWERIAPYLDRVLELAPDARESWLLELTVSEPEMAATVRQMLAEHRRLDAQGFLANPPPLAAAISRAGTRVGAYTIERLIGRGGMGEVWLAARNDGRFEGSCAIKFLDASLSSAKLADRFRREGHLLARLTHPNIARLLDAGAADDGTPFLALEYVNGERIDQYCTSRSLSIEARVQLVIEVIAAIAHAHSQLIVHRDIKPTNVLVTADGSVKLLDFGIAKLLTAEPLADGLTRVEEVVLTPEYAAPEQILGEPPSTATDVYQLGLLLYVLLSGQHPRSRGGTREARLRAALDDKIPRASELTDGATSKQLRGDLDAILDTALRRDPAARYLTAQALADDLLRFLDDQPVLARRGATWYRVRKFVRRHRLAVAASVTLFLTLVAGVVGTTWQARVAADRAQRLSVTKSFLIDVFRVNSSAQQDPLKAQQTTARELLARAADRVTQHLDNAQVDGEEMLNILGDLHLELGLPEKSAELQKRRIEVLQTLYGLNDVRTVDALLDYAEALYFTNASRDAAAPLAAAERILDRNGDVSSGVRARQLRLMAVNALGRDYERARGYAARAVALYRRQSTPSAELVEALRAAGAAESGSNNRAKALPFLMEALRANESIGGAETSLQQQLLVDVAEIQTDLMQLDEAEKNFRSAMQITERINGELHINTLQTSMRYGIYLRKSGRLQPAREALSTVEAVAQRALPATDAYHLPTIRMELARVELMLGGFANAAALYRQALAGREPVRSNDFQHANILQNYAAALAELGNSDESVAMATRAGAMFKKAGTPTGTTLVPIVLATAHTSVGRDREALAALDQYAEGRERLEPAVKIRVEIRRGAALAGLSPKAAEEVLRTQLQALHQLPHAERYRWIEGDARMTLGRLLLAQRRATEAKELIEPVVAWRAEDMPASSVLLADSRVALAACLFELGDRRLSRELQRQAASIYAQQQRIGDHYRRPFEVLTRQLSR